MSRFAARRAPLVSDAARFRGVRPGAAGFSGFFGMGEPAAQPYDTPHEPLVPLEPRVAAVLLDPVLGLAPTREDLVDARPEPRGVVHLP